MLAVFTISGAEKERGVEKKLGLASVSGLWPFFSFGEWLRCFTKMSQGASRDLLLLCCFGINPCWSLEKVLGVRG